LSEQVEGLLCLEVGEPKAVGGVAADTLINDF
jgi:hypothetical protein